MCGGAEWVWEPVCVDVCDDCDCVTLSLAQWWAIWANS